MAIRRSTRKKRKSDGGGRQDEDDEDEEVVEEVVDKDARVRLLEEASALLLEQSSTSDNSVADLQTQVDDLRNDRKQAFCALFVGSTGVSSEVASVVAGVKLQRDSGSDVHTIRHTKDHPYFKRVPSADGRPWDKKSDSCLLYTSPSPRDRTRSRMPSSA